MDNATSASHAICVFATSDTANHVFGLSFIKYPLNSDAMLPREACGVQAL